MPLFLLVPFVALCFLLKHKGDEYVRPKKTFWAGEGKKGIS